MKSKTEYLKFKVPERMGFVNLTPQVEEVVRDSGVKEGLCLVGEDNGDAHHKRQVMGREVVIAD